MGMNDLLKAFQLIDENKDFMSGPKSEELIQKAEQALDLNFPPTYRTFLKKYGCGGIGGFEIYGITRDFDYASIPNGIWLTLDERKDDYLPKHFIIVSDTGDGYWYCLDASQVNASGEYPVVIWGLGIPEKNKEKVAEDFGEFLFEEVQQALSADED